jgi:outer membrane receptor protein involved in Fe transport
LYVTPSGSQLAAFGSLRLSPTARFTADLGARWDRSTLRASTDDSFGPRVGVRYELAPRTFLRASWGRFYQSQSINELQISDGVEQFFAPQQADHTVVGLAHEFPSGTELRVEGYEKRLRDLRPRFENLLHELTLLPELKPDRIVVDPDSGRARGVEISVSRHGEGGFDWWAAVSYASVTDRVAGVDVARSWDQRHAVAGGFNRQMGPWNVSLAVSQRSAWPTTPVLDLDTDGPVAVLHTGPRNSERGDFFRSVDARAEREFALRRSRLVAYAEITNVFDRSNSCCTEFQVEHDELGDPVLELTPIDYLPRVPSLGFVWSF